MNTVEQERTRMNDNERVFTENEAARYLQVSRTTLATSRMEKRKPGAMPAPPFIRLGRNIRYLKADLDEWIRKHRVTKLKPRKLHKTVKPLGRALELSVTPKARRSRAPKQLFMPYTL